MAATVGTREGYVGEKRQLIREGYGIYHYENKFFRYEGEWLNGKKHGHGKLIMADGSYYEGEFTQGEITGHGFKSFSASGNTYSGEFVQGEQHGQGVMNYSNGTVYEGMWCRNRRQGYGVLRQSDNSVYQGYMHNNKRHGEGTQIYSDGERYDGDWVNDMRQGHGEQRIPDGTVYDGQWRNDVYNGQGTIVHASGVVYEGLWINGFPALMGSKLAVRDVAMETPLEVTQGSAFSLDVVTVNEEGEFVEETGRELHVWAGYKFTPPKDDKATPPETTGLFDMIEDVEEKPRETPFGYSIVAYPLIENYNPGDLSTEASFVSGLGGRQRTDLSGAVLEEEEAPAKVFGTDATTSEAPVEDPITTSGAPGGSTGGPADSVSGETETIVTANTDLSEPPGAPLTAPLPPRRTTKGLVSLRGLLLPAPPPMYRPHAVQDAEDERRTDSRAKGSRQGRRPSEVTTDKPDSRSSTKTAVGPSKKTGDERFAQPGGSTAGSGSESVTPTDTDHPARNHGNTGVSRALYADPGDYVLVIEESTDPPFLGRRMSPVYLPIRVTLPSPGKKARGGRKGGAKGPTQKWDTSEHITGAISQRMAELAKRELEGQIYKSTHA